jgi:preprotein translocase subunit YajC
MPQAQSMNSLMQFVPFVFIFIIFYFLLIRPQKQQEKKHKEMISKLDKNAEIVTIAGIHGTIVGVKDKTFMLRVDDNTKIEIDKSAVARVIKS